MRTFKSTALYNLSSAVGGAESSLRGPMGIFGAEFPDEEYIAEVVDDVKNAVEDYVKLCPSKMGPEILTLAKEMHQESLKGMEVGDLFSGRFNEAYYDFGGAVEVFTGSAIDGLHEETTGILEVPGPFSDDEWTRHRCASLLNNAESAGLVVQEFLDLSSSYMSPVFGPVYDRAVEVSEAQADYVGSYQRECTREPLPEVPSIGQAQNKIVVDWREVKDLEDKYSTKSFMGQRFRYDYSEEERKAGFEKMETLGWDVMDAMEKQNELVGKFVDSEWDRQCKVRKWKGIRRGGSFHPETMENWIERVKRKWASLPSVDAKMALGEDRIFQDMMATIETKLSYGRKLRDQESFRRYFLEADVDDIGKMETWKVPGTDRYTQFNKDYIEKTLEFWSDPDNVARAKILLSKIEDQVKGRTRYGVRGGIAQAPGHILAWSNGCMCWNVFRKQYQPGEELYLDANYIFVPGDYETLDRIRWLLPDLPLIHMDWTKTMDLSFREARERERFR